MLAIVDDSNLNSLAVLDTDDGVVERVTLEQLKLYRGSGLRFFKRPDLKFVSTEHRNMTRCISLRGEFGDKFKKSFFDKIRLLATVVDNIAVPDEVNSELSVQVLDDCFFVNLFNTSGCYLYSVTKSGIFCLSSTIINNFCVRGVVSVDDMFSVRFLSQSEIADSITLIVDKELHIIDRVAEQNSKNRKMGVALGESNVLVQVFTKG